MDELTAERFETASAHGEARLQGPRAEWAHYDAERDRAIVRLTTGNGLEFAPHSVQGLQNASLGDLEIIEIEAFWLGIHFPAISADFYVPVLLDGQPGSRRWMAAQLGAAGGRTRTDAKVAASRKNGKRGGRPRKAIPG